MMKHHIRQLITNEQELIHTDQIIITILKQNLSKQIRQQNSLKRIETRRNVSDQVRAVVKQVKTRRNATKRIGVGRSSSKAGRNASKRDETYRNRSDE